MRSTQPANEFHIVVFDELVKNGTGKNINGLTVKITQTESLVEIETSQVVFLADEKRVHLSEIPKAAEGKSIMVIAASEGLFKKGARLQSCGDG